MTNVVFVEIGDPHEWKVSPLASSEIVMKAKLYDDDLGMKRHGELYRQLRRDIPRCKVLIDGYGEANVATVHRKAPFPRMCTQAVYAPVLEWLLSNKITAFEHPLHRTFLIEIDTAELTMSLTKHFRYVSTNGMHICDTLVNIHVHAPSDLLVVSNCPSMTAQLPIQFLYPPSQDRDECITLRNVVPETFD